MEITNEIKAKVFAQYLGQKCKIKNFEPIYVLSHAGIAHIGITDEVNNVGSPCGFNEIEILLKPLSQISDEDAIEVAKIQYKSIDAERLYHNAETGKCSAALCNIPTLCGFACQFLQSRGYDLPNYLLGGKTLNEAGLAIYE